MSSFHVDARIDVKLEVELALRLGEMILNSGTEDKQILALGHNLCNIDKEENETKSTWSRRPESSVASGWQEETRKKPAVSSMRDKVSSKIYRDNNREWGIE